MVSMCAQMMAFAIVLRLVTWFAIRGGQAWGLWAVTAAALAQLLGLDEEELAVKREQRKANAQRWTVAHFAFSPDTLSKMLSALRPR